MRICDAADESGLSNNCQAKLKADMCLQIAAGCERYGCQIPPDCRSAPSRDSKPRRGRPMRGRPTRLTPAPSSAALPLQPDQRHQRRLLQNRRCQRIKAAAGRFHPALLFDAVPRSLTCDPDRSASPRRRARWTPACV